MVTLGLFWIDCHFANRENKKSLSGGFVYIGTVIVDLAILKLIEKGC